MLSDGTVSPIARVLTTPFCSHACRFEVSPEPADSHTELLVGLGLADTHC